MITLSYRYTLVLLLLFTSYAGPQSNIQEKLQHKEFTESDYYKQEHELKSLEAAKKETADGELIQFQFENADLAQLVEYIQDLFEITFITYDSLDPLPEGTQSLQGHKISFRTNDPLTKQEVWNLFLTFLDLAGFSVVPESDPKLFQIVSNERVRTEPLPTYIGIPLDKIPSNDQVIRYVYFVRNTTLASLKPLLEKLKSPSSVIVTLQEHRAILLIDKAYNVKSLIELIQELDKVSRPQAMSILKLKQADAVEVKKLYESLVPEEQRPTSRFFPTRKPPSTLYFPEEVRMIAEPRTNTLILLGPEKDIQKIEEFIVKYVDVDIKRPYSPLYVYDLQYAEANAVVEILKQVTQFGTTTQAGQVGGVRAGDKYFKPMTFTAEPETNRVIIKADYEDYLKIKEVIQQLDEPQPQVAIEVLILNVVFQDTKILGAQIRSKEPFGTEGLLGQNVKFQTSGLQTGPNFGRQGIVENPNGSGVFRLLGDLINLAQGAAGGNTLISLGDRLGVWGIFQLLEQISSTDVIANPFLIATNKTKARVSIGEARRVVSSQVVGAGTPVDAFATENANLTVDIIPQINSDGMIVLELIVSIDTFLGTENNPLNVAKSTRKIVTKTIVADKEVLALGGLVQDTIANDLSTNPVLGRIPILGWLFKNKLQREEHDSLLVLISTRIIDPTEKVGLNSFSEEHIGNFYEMSALVTDENNVRDPIGRLFFSGAKNVSTDRTIDSFIRPRERKITRRKRRRRKRARQAKSSETISKGNNDS